MKKDKETQAVVPTKKQNIIQAIKFTLISISAGVIDMGSCLLLEKVFSLPLKWCSITGTVLSVIWNFTINRRYTFKSAANVPIAMLKVALFYVIFLPLSYWATAQLELLNIDSILIKAATMIANFVLEFLYCRLVVYRGKMYTNDLGQKEMEELAKAENQE